MSIRKEVENIHCGYVLCVSIYILLLSFEACLKSKSFLGLIFHFCILCSATVTLNHSFLSFSMLEWRTQPNEKRKEIIIMIKQRKKSTVKKGKTQQRIDVVVAFSFIFYFFLLYFSK